MEETPTNSQLEQQVAQAWQSGADIVKIAVTLQSPQDVVRLTQFALNHYSEHSVRAIVVDASHGQEMAQSVFAYPRWAKQLYCDAVNHQFRQHPLDYLEGLTHCIRDCVEQMGPEKASRIKGLSIDTTGSTPVAVDESGTPLALLEPFADNPHAMFVLWKDHTATQEAAQINELAAKTTPNYLQFVGALNVPDAHRYLDEMIPTLSKAASQIEFDEHDELAVDWLNGRRTPYANQALT
ncbi:unnamed protein product, partial [Darwinula stevensoni]